MGLKIYNTLTRKKQLFEPVKAGKVAMYVCGVTVYDMCHIGHGRSVVLFDVIFRHLRSLYDVTYVRNFTDVDDKIINRANDLGEDWKGLAERYVNEFYIDMDALGVLRPTFEPRATEHIREIQELIGKLLEKGHAYEMDGDVMFSVKSFRPYGKLSGKRPEDLISGARVEVDERKRNPLDFALWKAVKPGEPFWESPWGPGRPGWHIECSAMSMAYLGETFDIHGGGADLTFPHHENEIAQSEAATAHPFAKYWIHNGFVNIRSEKMSKSLGNVLNIRDILKEVHPETLRLFLLSSHYRSPLDYNETSIREAAAGLERLYAAMVSLNDLIRARGTGSELPAELSGIKDRFTQAMDDDFNTPRCLAILFEAARAINRLGTASTSSESIPAPEPLTAAKHEIMEVAPGILGLLNEDPDEFLEKMRKRGAGELLISEQEILDQIAQRSEARKKKDFRRADEIRNQLAAVGILLEDGPDGTTWRIGELP
ncbi:MAG TPA: cysteine--tRNA ligase [Desulfomonilaceae bacterium]|nr:cysteine--tRNA ligase [Desulfomonilaceae bacterium]